MFKMRMPYDYSQNVIAKEYQIHYFDAAKKLGIDFVSNHKNKKFMYLDGEIYLQAWAGKKSTETRLIGSEFKFKEYDIKENEEKLYYYNMVLRGYAYCYNDNANRKLGFDHCHDCALENYIWKQYISDKNNLPVISYVKTLNDYTARNLFLPGYTDDLYHGFMFNPNSDWYNKRFKVSYYHTILKQSFGELKIKAINRNSVEKNIFIPKSIIFKEITQKIPSKYVEMYLYELERNFKMKKTIPSLEYTFWKNNFPVLYGAKLFRTCIHNKKARTFALLFHVLLNYKIKYIVIYKDAAEEYYSDHLSILCDMFNVIIISLGIKTAKKINEIPTQGYNKYSSDIEDFDFNPIKENALLIPRSAEKKDPDVCIFSAQHMANGYLLIKKHKFKYYLTSFMSSFDLYCFENMDYNKIDGLLEAKKQGYDMKKHFKNEKKFIYVSGDKIINLYGHYVSANLSIIGEYKHMKLIEYNAKDLSEKGFYHNAMTRSFRCFENKYVHLGLDHCFDCSSIGLLLGQYEQKTKKRIPHNIKSIIKLIMNSHNPVMMENNIDDNKLSEYYINELQTRKQLRAIKEK